MDTEVHGLSFTRYSATGVVPLPVTGPAHWILVERGVLRECVDGVEGVLEAGDVVFHPDGAIRESALAEGEVHLTVITATGPRARRATTAPASVERARRYIDVHYRERISLDDVATAAGVTPDRLRSDLARWCGDTFVGLLRQRRVAAAVRLLQANRPMDEIAIECGFCDPSHFARAFRRVHGVNPARYRRDVR